MLQYVRSLVQSAGITGRRSGDGFLLSPDRFELAATAERMRVDRNGSLVSLLLLEPSAEKNSPREIQGLERRMAERLRLTDTAGWLRDGRIGLLLPDTPEAGAWKVAADLCETYEAGVDRPRCEVIVYPESDPPTHDPPSGDGPRAGVAIDDSENGGGSGDYAGAGAPGGATGQASSATSRFDSLMLKPLPIWKRGLDLLGASLGLAIASPVLATAVIAIRLTSRGPAFFIQEREGLGGKRFPMYKLRTMLQDAENQKASLRDSSEQDGPAFKIADDPRITTVGRLLRKTSLDELPQLWNVLRGEMSLVGPRPLPVDESLACKPWQRRRLHVTPGLTCTWQIHGRNVVPFDDWIRMDLDYAERRSPWLDLKLVAQTGPSVILQKGR
ncbi:putative sugar transferase EpsL [Planctomycetes bacterium MalM25]|nr:putative sugar transferase EpsL [Planctomycetes bacterium MalM25]